MLVGLRSAVEQAKLYIDTHLQYAEAATAEATSSAPTPTPTPNPNPHPTQVIFSTAEKLLAEGALLQARDRVGIGSASTRVVGRRGRPPPRAPLPRP